MSRSIGQGEDPPAWPEPARRVALRSRNLLYAVAEAVGRRVGVRGSALMLSLSHQYAEERAAVMLLTRSMGLNSHDVGALLGLSAATVRARLSNYITLLQTRPGLQQLVENMAHEFELSWPPPPPAKGGRPRGSKTRSQERLSAAEVRQLHDEMRQTAERFAVAMGATAQYIVEMPSAHAGPERQLLLVLLLDSFGSSYAEVGEALGLSRSAVSVGVHRGRQLLQQRPDWRVWLRRQARAAGRKWPAE